MEKDKNTLVWVFIVVVVIIILIGMGGYGMMGFGSMVGFGMGFGFIFMLLFWGLVIWLIITLINTNQTNKDEPDSLTILKKRYASGEITKKQYEEMKKELR